MNLYRKYRPATFGDIIGNQAAVESLEKQLNKKDQPHSFLISGPSGCGKTTLARIAANIIGASELSIQEINTANNRGIDTARTIIDNNQYSSPDGKPIVYIIDEVHQTTKDWQNAMLKPLEDTPNHVYFFLCTTDPGKLLKDIKTRCTSISVKPLIESDLYKLVRKVHLAEEGNLSKEILHLIAKNSDGSARTALVLLENVIEMEDEEKIREVINLGTDANSQTIDLCRLLLKRAHWKEISVVLRGLTGEDPEKIRRAVLGYMNAVLLKTFNNQAVNVMECFQEPVYNTGFPGITLSAIQSSSEYRE